MKTGFKIILSLLFALWAVLVFMTLSGCTIPSMFNEGSYGKKWENTFVWFDPNDLQELRISNTGILSTSKAIKNSDSYLVKWEADNQNFKLEITSYESNIDAIWFEGSVVYDIEEEANWEKDGNTYSLEGEELNPPVNGFYRIMLSENLAR